MNGKKLTPVLAGCGAALALLSAPATAATAGTAGTVTTATAVAAQRDSTACIKPSGKKTNYSWTNGNSSTTVYFNNHCSHRVYAKLHFKGPAGTRTECLATNGGTKGKKKFRKGLAENLTNISKDC
ncbi:hypothetical protein E1292_04460 [Nonomuraea deserti]|uniref:Uncharacterized protein n=1 Tax=Nonomuraea deserti TaxID=1848322 RepID=A0A4R4VZX5_9ACTN|nr:hypothetical protein [Nonomuraea deserti]TDD11769.1 hypothetical protein E1292_04460 [Nonomuraea deserti]